MKIFLNILLFFLMVSFAACGTTGTSSSGATQTGGTETGTTETVTTSDTVLYDGVLDVAPAFSPVGSSSISKALNTSWETGNPLYGLFYILREFDPDTDQEVIDTSNLFKTMYEAKNYMGSTRSECTAITEQAITPPFDFGNAAVTYNCAYNKEAENGYDIGGAMKDVDANGDVIAMTAEQKETKSATAKYGLFGFVWPGDHNEYGVLQGFYDAATSALSVDIAVWVDYAGNNDFCYRNDIDGNAATHLFTFRSMKGNLVEGSDYLSIVGKGISQGAGNYFLIKMTNNDITGKYYCIGADDGETELMAMEVEGSDTVPENCAAYQADVDAMTMFTTADLACQSSDFNPDGTGTAAEGTIFLDFQ